MNDFELWAEIQGLMTEFDYEIRLLVANPASWTPRLLEKCRKLVELLHQLVRSRLGLVEQEAY